MVVSRIALVVVAAGEFGAEVEEAPRAREIEIRDPDGSRVRDAHGSWTGATRNFLERRYVEVRRIPLPRTPLNRGIKKGPEQLRPSPGAGASVVYFGLGAHTSLTDSPGGPP